MGEKAVFLDRDGTINVEKDYLFRIEEFEFLPKVIDGLRLLQAAGYLLIVITNQSGIARGYYTENDYQKLTAWMCSTLKIQNVLITDVYHCPHHPDAVVPAYRKNCDCRKPKLGLFWRAVEQYDLDLSRCYAVGDKLRDCAICQTTDCHGFLVGDHETEAVVEAIKAGKLRNTLYAEDLYSCALNIVNKG